MSLISSIDINNLEKFDDEYMSYELMDDLLSWANKNIDDNLKLQIFLNRSKDLDGCYSEYYGCIIYDIYLKDKLNFISVASNNENLFEPIIFDILFELNTKENIKKEVEFLKKLRLENNLNKRENNFIKTFINVLQQ